MMKILSLLLLPIFLFAIEAKVKIEIDKSQDFFVSKKMKLVLKVMSTGFQMNNLEVDYSDNKDFVILAPQSAAYNMTEGDYSVVVYEYELYPLKKGKVDLKPWKVSFDASLGYAMPKSHFQKRTKNHLLNIDSIKGYDFLLATSQLKISTTYSSQNSIFKIGEALEREITLTAVDVPDLLIPSISSLSLEGIQTYEDESRLSQKKSNDKIISTRVQKETYVFNTDGNYTLPKTVLHWYNTKTKKVEKIEIKGKSFVVTAPPLSEVEIEKDATFNLFYLLYVISFLFFVSFIFYVYKKREPSLKTRAKSLLVKSINPGKK